MSELMDGVELRAPLNPRYAEILTPDAVAFAVGLQRAYNARRKELLAARAARQARLDAGEHPDFLPGTESVRKGDWTVPPLPADLLDRRVEIMGPVDRKMVINALNSGAKVFMADFEDSTTPTWTNVMEGQINLRDAVRRTITVRDPNTGKDYKLAENPAVLFVRASGWHLQEQHVLVDGEPMIGSIFDFALYCFHNAKEPIARGSGPYFYLPKMESHLEARLWNELFVAAESHLEIPAGTISRAQLWQWVHHGAKLDDGRAVTAELCETYINEELSRVKGTGDDARYDAYQQAAGMLRTLISSPKFGDFLTRPAYDRVVATEVFAVA